MRIALSLLVIAVAIGAGGYALGSSGASTDVRINARQLEDGRVEFALEHEGERILPSQRYFPADAEVGRWLYSSSVAAADVTVRIGARRLEDGRTEFGLQRAADDEVDSPRWGETHLPSVRFFPADVEVGRWLHSSTLDLSEPAEPVPANVPITADPAVTLERADLDGWAYNGLEHSFYYGTEVNPLTDHVRTWIVKVAATDDDLYDTMRLQIACESDGEVSTLIWDDGLPYMPNDETVRVAWRIDGGDVVRGWWGHNVAGNDVVYPSARFAAALPSADSVVVQIAFHSRTLTTTFNNVGDMFRTRVQPNIEHCGRY